MIETIEFKNFKCLKDAKLDLSRLTVMVGANGSGKSTAIQALQSLVDPGGAAVLSDLKRIRTVGVADTESVSVTIAWGHPHSGRSTYTSWSRQGYGRSLRNADGSNVTDGDVHRSLLALISGIRVFALDAQAIAADVSLDPYMQLHRSGAHLAGVLDQLRDGEPERFESLNRELGEWMPEFDRVLFETPNTGTRRLLLRTRIGRHSIPAGELSQGVLLALAILTLAYLPNPPSLVCLEEPERGIHPRLLRQVKDCLNRLAHPKAFGDARKAVQVLATTHSPYFLDLFKERPEEIIIAHKAGLEAKFESLSDRADLDEILAQAPLGEIWYSGILGGIPTEA